MKDFTKTIDLKATDREIFEALTISISKWWSEDFEGEAQNEGDVFTVRFGPAVFKTFVVEEIIPRKKVVWRVTDTLIDLPELQNKKEWLGTKVIWEISQNMDGFTLDLIHVGLTPQIECYTICETGWNDFVKSLSEFVETGIGKPYKEISRSTEQ